MTIQSISKKNKILKIKNQITYIRYILMNINTPIDYQIVRVNYFLNSYISNLIFNF